MLHSKRCARMVVLCLLARGSCTPPKLYSMVKANIRMFHSEVQGFRAVPPRSLCRGGRGADVDQGDLEQGPSVKLRPGPLLRATKAIGKLAGLRCRTWVVSNLVQYLLGLLTRPRDGLCGESGLSETNLGWRKALR